jgi:hypothetical protein
LNRQEPTANRQPPTANRQKPTAKSQPPKANRQKPTANSQQPKANSQPPTAIYSSSFFISQMIVDKKFHCGCCYVCILHNFPTFVAFSI